MESQLLQHSRVGLRNFSPQNCTSARNKSREERKGELNFDNFPPNCLSARAFNKTNPPESDSNNSLSGENSSPH